MPELILVVADHPVCSVEGALYAHVELHAAQPGMFTIIVDERDTSSDVVAPFEAAVATLARLFASCTSSVALIVTSRTSSTAVRRLLEEVRSQKCLEGRF